MILATCPILQHLTRKKREAQETLEDALHVAISALPEKCRVVFNLSRFEQLSHREIAEKEAGHIRQNH